jgi:hypothetical protein
MPLYPPVEDEALENGDLAASFRRRHQEFYGKLLEVHAAVDNSGTLTLAVYLISLLVAYAALWGGWYEQVPALANIELNNFWTYLALLAVALFGYTGHAGWIERWHYSRHRHALQDLATKAGVSRYQLLARLEDDAAVKKALAMIKRDRWEFGDSM